MSRGFTLKETIEILERYNLKLNKGLGQNFLVDKNILKKVVDSADITSEDMVLEIGPGIGTLTRELASRARKVVAVEIDSRLIPVLKETTALFSNVEIINRDVMDCDLRQIWEAYFAPNKVKVVANLPYYVTSPVLMKLLEEDIPLERISVMVQKEVAQRMAAVPGTKDYGALTVAVQFYSSPRIVATVPPTVFIPPPRVHSAIVRLDVQDGPRYRVRDRRLLFALVKAAFGQRRKTLLNALKGFKGLPDKEDIREVLNRAGIDPARRGETLPIEEFCRLADCIEAYISGAGW